jgi:hypothetical protein
VNLAAASCEASGRRADASVQSVSYLPRSLRRERARYSGRTCPAAPLPATPADSAYDLMTLAFSFWKFGCSGALVSTVEVMHRVREGALLGVDGRRLAIARRRLLLVVTRFRAMASRLVFGRLG